MVRIRENRNDKNIVLNPYCTYRTTTIMRKKLLKAISKTKRNKVDITFKAVTLCVKRGITYMS